MLAKTIHAPICAACLGAAITILPAAALAQQPSRGSGPPGAATNGPPAASEPARPQPATLEPARAAPVTPLDQITVTATRNPIRAFDFPGMVTPVGPSAIEQSVPTNPRDVFFSVPGVDFGGGARRTGQTPSIRGFSGPDIVVTIDGARQDFVTAHDGRFFVDPSLLRRVDVVRGPTSALYGSGGLGGTIAFETIDPADLLAPGARFGFRTSVGGQSVNREFNLGAGVAVRPTDSLSFLAYVVGRNSGDIRLGNGVDLIAKDAVRTALVKGVYDDGELKGRLSWLRFTNTPTEPGNPQVGNPTRTFPLVRREVLTDQLSAEARWAPGWNPWIDFGARVYRVETQNDERPLGGGALFARTLTTTGFTVDNRSRFMLGPNAGALLTVGVDGARNDFSTNASQAPGQNNGTPEGRTGLFGAFAQADITWKQPFGLPGQLLITPGLRWDTYASENANNRDNKAEALSPRIGVSYAPVEWGFVFANVGKAFRAPTLTELYADGIHFRLGPLVVNRFIPNPDLRPQTALTYEAGFGLRFNDLWRDGDSLRLKASYYVSDVSNLISTSVLQPAVANPACFGAPLPSCAAFNGTTQVRNVGKAELRGFEVEGRYDAGLFYLGGHLWTVDGKDKVTGASVGALAPLIARLDGGFRLFENRLTVGARATFASKFDKGTLPGSATPDPAQVRSGYAAWDLYARIDPRLPGLEGLKIDLGVDNVFDRPYEVVFANAREPGRNFKALVSYSRSW